MSENCDVPKDYKSLWKDFTLLYNSDYVLMQEWGEAPLIFDCSEKKINIKEIIKINRNEHHDDPYLFYDDDLYLFYVEVEGKTGYMRAFDTEWNLYEDGRWSIEGQIESSERKWITITKVTDEKEIIDGREGRWLYIEYENIKGWVLKGYVSEEIFWRYYAPEEIIDMFFTWGQP